MVLYIVANSRTQGGNWIDGTTAADCLACESSIIYFLHIVPYTTLCCLDLSKIAFAQARTWQIYYCTRHDLSRRMEGWCQGW